MFREDRDYRIGTTQEGSDTLLILFILIVVVLATDFALYRLFGADPVAVWVIFLSMVTGVVVAGAAGWWLYTRRMRIRSTLARLLAEEREAETQKQIDAMLRNNSRIPTVTRENGD